MIRVTLCLILTVGGLAAQSPKPEPVLAHEKLHAALWAQTSVEFRGGCLQAYSAASRMLDLGLQDPRWSAAIEQQGRDPRSLPPAIIVDVDETVLDNSPSQARMIAQDADFGEVWQKWVEESAAEPIPGALEFLREAAARGVTVFYITNREKHMEAATRRNLERLGFPLAHEADAVLTKGERPGWTSDKSSRRAAIAVSYRIVLLVGDDLGDFLPGIHVPPEERLQKAAPYESFWGRKWIILPNALYGTWEEAAYGFDRSLSREEKLRRKRARLREP